MLVLYLGYSLGGIKEILTLHNEGNLLHSTTFTFKFIPLATAWYFKHSSGCDSLELFETNFTPKIRHTFLNIFMPISAYYKSPHKWQHLIYCRIRRPLCTANIYMRVCVYTHTHTHKRTLLLSTYALNIKLVELTSDEAELNQILHTAVRHKVTEVISADINILSS
jgi:hypothetical protein